MKNLILIIFILWGFGRITKAEVYELPTEIKQQIEIILDYPIIKETNIKIATI